MGVDFQFGDIIENGYASYDNPTRVGVFIRYGSNPRGSLNAGRFIECRSGNGSFWKTDPGNDRLKKIGSIFSDCAPSHTSGEVTEDDVAARMWKAEAEDCGAPASVAENRTRAAFDDQASDLKDRWRKFARAAIATLRGDAS